MADPIVLDSSYKILENSDGDLEIEVLKSLLAQAHLKGLEDKDLVTVVHHERVEDFDPKNPLWHDVEYNIPLSELKQRYFENDSNQNYEYQEGDEIQEKIDKPYIPLFLRL